MHGFQPVKTTKVSSHENLSAYGITNGIHIIMHTNIVKHTQYYYAYKCSVEGCLQYWSVMWVGGVSAIQGCGVGWRGVCNTGVWGGLEGCLQYWGVGWIRGVSAILGCGVD